MLRYRLQTWWTRRRLLGRLDGMPDAVASWVRGFAPPSPSTPCDEVRFVVFDTEATGLDVERDRLLTLAGVGMRGRAIRPGDSLEVAFRGDTVGPDSAPVHGLVPQDLADGVVEAAGVERFLSYVGNAVLVAHHAAFDVAMLDRVLRALGGARLLNPVLDTEHLARRLRGPATGVSDAPIQRHSLDDLAARYDLETRARHTAAGDALLTAHVLQRLLAVAERRGIRRLGALLR